MTTDLTGDFELGEDEFDWDVFLPDPDEAEIAAEAAALEDEAELDLDDSDFDWERRSATTPSRRVERTTAHGRGGLRPDRRHGAPLLRGARDRSTETDLEQRTPHAGSPRYPRRGRRGARTRRRRSSVPDVATEFEPSWTATTSHGRRSAAEHRAVDAGGRSDET